MPARREWVVAVLLLVATLPLVTARIYASDEIAYFSYLRSFVIDGDLEFHDEYLHFAERDPLAQAKFARDFLPARSPTGLTRNINPAGSAVLWSPWYLAVHAARGVLGLEGRTGFERPYVRAVCYGSTLHAFAGLLLLYGFVRAGVDRWAAAAAVGATWFGTNLFFYMYVTPPMSHANSFLLASGIVVLWARSRHERDLTSRMGLGLLVGLAAMVREQNALFLVLPGLDTAVAMATAARGARWRDVAREAAVGLTCLAFAVLAFTPQLAVYRVLNGGFHPHSEATQKMLWGQPAIFGLLFSGWHGFFSWSPLALPGLLGLVLLAARRPGLALPLLVHFALVVYASAAYRTWEAGSSFGARRLIATLPALTLGSAHLAGRAWARGRRGRVLVVTTLLAGLLWNGGLIVQYGTGMIPRGKRVTFAEILHNQVFVVPVEGPRKVWRYLTDRGALYKVKP